MKKRFQLGERLLSAIFIIAILFSGYAVNESLNIQLAQAEEKNWAPERLLAQPKGGGLQGAKAAIKAQGGDVEEFIPKANTIVIRVPEQALEAVERALSRNPNFKSVSKDYLRYQHSTTPNDYWYPAQWHLNKIQASLAWGVTLGEQNVTIAVIDGGAAVVSDLAQKLLPGINIIEGGTDTTDTGGHGTAVTGIAAAMTNNSVGVAGISWHSKVLPVKVYTSTGSTTCSAIIKGIVWAADNGAKVINMSFGGPYECSGEKSAIDYAWSKGAVLVASAGNDSSSTPNYPAAYSNVIAVSSTDSNDSLSFFSNYGNWINVAAPGRNLYTTYNNGAYAGFSGTSAAAPVVSGIAALVLSANPGLTNSQVKSIIEKNADDLGTAGFDPYYGWGRVNAYKAVLAAINTAPPQADTVKPTVSITAPASGSTLSGSAVIDVSAADNVGVSRVELYIDGILFATDTSSPYSFVWDTTTSSNGTHTLQAVAYDAAGNIGSSSLVSVNVSNLTVSSDTTPPVVVINTPADGSTLTKITKITISSSDNVQVSQMWVYANGKLIGTANCASASCTTTFSWNTKSLAKGLYTILAEATDTSGNKGISKTVNVHKQ